MTLPARPSQRHPHIAREEDAIIRSYFHLPPLLPDYLYHDDVCFSYDGELFAVTSNSTILSIFKTDGCQFERTIQNKKYGNTKSVFHPKQSNKLYLNSGPNFDHAARLLDIQTGSFIRYFGGDGLHITSLAASGSLLVTASADRNVRIWDEVQKSATGIIQTREASNAAMHPNGRCLAVGSASTLALYDMRNLAAPVRSERIEATADSGPHFGMRGKGLLFSGRGYAGEYCLTDLSIIAPVRDVQDDCAAPATYSPDESFFCVPARDNTIVVYDSADGAVMTVLAGHESSVNAIAFCPSFHNLVSVGQSCLFWTIDRGTFYALWPN
jgi:WD40 repeat protein